MDFLIIRRESVWPEIERELRDGWWQISIEEMCFAPRNDNAANLWGVVLSTSAISETRIRSGTHRSMSGRVSVVPGNWSSAGRFASPAGSSRLQRLRLKWSHFFCKFLHHRPVFFMRLHIASMAASHGCWWLSRWLSLVQSQRWC